MKMKVNLIKKKDSFQVFLIIIDTEKGFSNKLFKDPLDYPSSKYYDYLENDSNSINYIENIFLSEEGAKIWINKEINALKDKLEI